MTFEEVHDDDDEEEEWIPMVDDERQTHEEPAAQRLDTSPPRVAYSTSETRRPQSTKPAPRAEPIPRQSNAKLQDIQNKLQDRISIQTHLVDRPLDYFWQRCLINLLRQMWTLELRIQVGILMLTTGLLMRVFLWSTWYLLYPRFAILSTVFLVSFFYIDPLDMHNQIKGTWKMVEALLSPSQQQEVVEGIDAHKLRRLSLFLFFVPTLLEIRTLSFLSRINAGLVMNTANEWSRMSLYSYNLGVAVCLLGVMLFLQRQRLKPCDVAYRGLLTLYGFSLWIALRETSVQSARQVPALAAPFLTATATLLFMHKDDGYEWLSRITRQAFRLSLRDVLSMVSEKVTDDDMLQLAILRWICDFWASSPTPQTKGAPASSAASSRTSFQSGSKQEQRPSASETTTPSTSNATVPFRHNSVRWEELQPMLNIEIDHMETEIDALRIEPTPSGSQGNEAGTGQSNSLPPRPTTFHPQNDHPLVGLKEMLLSFDVDERAQPAVLAFKRAVESFPPKKKTAVTISILRRCPALLTIMIHTVVLSDLHSLVVTSFVLSPFVVMEYYRISEWMQTCQRVKSRSSEVLEEEEQNDWRIPSSLRNVDTMTILLSGDENTVIRPPSLLIVWFNIVSSVSALEVGLSTARCVETTAVAIEFAGSAISLVKFGLEISENGLVHGLMVLAGEVLSIYGNGKDISNLDQNTARYTSAAVRTVRHGQKIVRNVSKISKDENIVSFAQPFLNFLSMLTGGKKQEKANDISESTDSDHELSLDEVDLRNKTETTLENKDGSKPTNDPKSDEEKMSTATTSLEADSIPANPEESNAVSSSKSDTISKSIDLEDDLAEVMEMIAASYEQGLIDQCEKDDFFKKLAALQAEELYDPSVLSAMKRTLIIILENGSMIPITQEIGSSDASHRPSKEPSFDQILSDAIAANLPDDYYTSLSQTKGSERGDEQEKEPQATQRKEENNDFMTLGVAALGVVASGLALSMKNDSQKADSNHHYIAIEGDTKKEEIKRERSPSIEIVELTDHNAEDEWVSLDD